MRTSHYVFMYHRSSSRELHDTPREFEEQNGQSGDSL